MIYAINRQTKEHRVVPRFDVYSNHDWRYVAADVEGWIECGGGECPVADGIDIQWKGEDGEVRGPVNGASVAWGSGAQRIIAYRPILDTKPEAPEWRGPQDGNPPAGTPVSVRTKECDSAAMVLANDHNIVVVRYESGMGFKYGGFDLSDVRPIRSAEDEAVHAMRAQDCEPFEGMLSRHDFCRAIYAAIRDGKIPGVKLEDAS